MNRKLLPVAISLVMSLGLPGLVSAKGPTGKIIITGGGLSDALEVTDPRVLNGASPWDGRFMDSSQGKVTTPSREPQPYEVAFYARRDGHLRMAYVVYYLPGSSGDRGFVYLPGRGEKHYSLNVRTIVRTGQDGEWHYASREWESLIKPFIAAAEVTAGQNSRDTAR